jgi:hypothetical protein
MGGFIFRMAPATISTVAKELIHIQANASVVVEVHQAQVTFHTTISESIDVALAIAATTNLVGATLTPVCYTGGATCLSTGYGPTASAAGGLSYLDAASVNKLTGYDFLPTPELRPRIKPGQRLVLRTDSTHTTDIIAQAFIKFMEFGNG